MMLKCDAVIYKLSNSQETMKVKLVNVKLRWDEKVGMCQIRAKREDGAAGIDTL